MTATDRAMAREEWVRIEALGDRVTIDDALLNDLRDRISELVVDRDRLARAVKDWQAHTTDAHEEAAELRAGISWARGMCTDGAPHERIDHFLGCVLAEHAELPPASDEKDQPGCGA